VVFQLPQLPRDARYPVTQRAASVAARATSGRTTCLQRGAAASTVLPSVLVQVAGVPSGLVMECTGNASQ